MDVLIYVAGPLFSNAEREYLEKIVNVLARSTQLDPLTNFFLPHRDGGELGKGPCRRDIFHLDLSKINSSEAIVALLDGQDSDSGTCVELGYAYATGKKIFGLLTDFRAYCTSDGEPHRPNLMVWGVCEEGKTLYNDIDSLAAAFQEFIISEKGIHPVDTKVGEL
jgi:nucleoside 2-deoxyribosyltransferase